MNVLTIFKDGAVDNRFLGDVVCSNVMKSCRVATLDVHCHIRAHKTYVSVSRENKCRYYCTVYVIASLLESFSNQITWKIATGS